MMTESQVKQVFWQYPKDKVQYKNDSEYYCDLEDKCRIIRKDGKGKLIYQFFLNAEMYSKVKKHFGAGSWTIFKCSVIHFYGGNYIYCEWSDGYREICDILGIKIKWQ